VLCRPKVIPLWAYDPDPRVRRGTALNIGFIAKGDSTPVPALINLLHDPDIQIQVAAVDALEQIGLAAETAVGAFVKKFNQSDNRIAGQILSALERE
jgi:HEAT repeat protein